MSLTSLEEDFETSGLIQKYEIISAVGRNKRGRKVWEVLLKERELSDEGLVI